MLSKIYSAGLLGIDGFIVTVECNAKTFYSYGKFRILYSNLVHFSSL